jgi:hypothetical protein
MKNLFFFFSILLSGSLVAQHFFKADIITKDNDTFLKRNIRIFDSNISLFESHKIDIIAKVKFIDSSGNKVVLKGKNIKRLSFVDSQGKTRIYEHARIEDDLSEIMHDGKIKWHREYRRHSYDQGIGFEEVWTTEKGESFAASSDKKSKSILKEITKAKPELASLIDEGKLKAEKIKRILSMYDE